VIPLRYVKPAAEKALQTTESFVYRATHRTCGRNLLMCCVGPGVSTRSTLPSTNCGMPPSTFCLSSKYVAPRSLNGAGVPGVCSSRHILQQYIVIWEVSGQCFCNCLAIYCRKAQHPCA
jgi:hypothetical protein